MLSIKYSKIVSSELVMSEGNNMFEILKGRLKSLLVVCRYNQRCFLVCFFSSDFQLAFSSAVFVHENGAVH